MTGCGVGEVGWGGGGGVGGGVLGDPSLPIPTIPLLPGPPHKIRSPPAAPAPSNLRHGGTGLPGLSPGWPPPGASPGSHHLRFRSTGTPPATTAAAQPPPGPLSAGQGGPPVPGGLRPGPPRRGRQWEALLPGRGCRYRGERRVDGGSRGRQPPRPGLSCFSFLLFPPGSGPAAALGVRRALPALIPPTPERPVADTLPHPTPLDFIEAAAVAI